MRPAGNYSYVFDAQSGSLDHALVSSSLNASVTAAEKWHINAKILLKFGISCTCLEDINGDGIVTNTDLGKLLLKFGSSCY